MDELIKLQAQKIEQLEKENNELKEWADNRQSELRKEIKRLNEKIYELDEENEKLKSDLEQYKKQYEHSMWEYNWKLTKWGYASFNEYWELMEEDTLQELRDIGEI